MFICKDIGAFDAAPPTSRRGRQLRNILLTVLIGDMLASSPGAFAQAVSGAETPATAATKSVKPAKPKPAGQKVQVTAEQPASSPGADTVSISVVAERPTNRIDRQVFDVKADISNTNGTAADALGNVPSVAVDPDGTVSLRGNPNVQILIDGKPSAMLQGDNRGSVLQSIPSEDIESIEVINNPGAQYGTEAGGGPILNIIMKRTRKPGGFGVVNTNAGSAGRYNSAVSGNYNAGRWGFQGGLNVRHDGRNFSGQDERERIDLASGLASRSTTRSASSGLNDSAGVNGGLHYNLGQKDTLSAQASYLARGDDSNGADHYRNFERGTDVLARDYTRASTRTGKNRNYSLATTWDHKGQTPGESLKLDLRLSGSSSKGESDYAYQYALPVGASGSRSLQGNDNDTRIHDFSGDYELPTESGGLVKAGLKLMDSRSDIGMRYLDVDPVTGEAVVNQRRTNVFALDQGNAALYGSYQVRLTENWGVLGGLRAEYTHVDIDQLTQQVDASNHYLNYIPSAFATYKLSDDSNLRLSYAHRLRRANAGELNPFIVYRDEFNESSGNPTLQPMQTDSFELGYETKAGPLEANLRGYYRKDKDTILWRRSFVADNVLLSRPENFGGSRASGLEFTLSGKVTPAFSLNASANLARSEQRQFDASGAELRRGASSLSGHARLNYQLGAADYVQLMLNAQGKTLTGQGYRKPTSSANLSWRHKVDGALSLVLNVTDIFSSQKIETVTDTPSLVDTNLRRFDGRIVYFGLSWRLGGVPRRPHGAFGHPST